MRKYVHWLKIDGYSKIEDTALQFFAIENYLNNYKSASAILYQYDYRCRQWFNKIGKTFN